MAPSKRAIERIKDRTKALTDRPRTPIPLPRMMGELNRALRGRSNDFHHRDSSDVFSKVKMHVEERVRTQLRRRCKLHNRAPAYRRFSGQVVHGRYRLFKRPTTAPWRAAHALV